MLGVRDEARACSMVRYAGTKLVWYSTIRLGYTSIFIIWSYPSYYYINILLCNPIYESLSRYFHGCRHIIKPHNFFVFPFS